MKKFISILIIIMLVFFISFVACNEEKKETTDKTTTDETTTDKTTTDETTTDKTTTDETVTETIKIGMSTDTGGVNDESFNASAWAGLQRAEKELGINVHYVESTSEADYDRNLESLASEKYDLIWGIGFLMEDAIKKSAGANPDRKFGIIDSNLGGNPPSNVVCVTFKEHEGSFLVGVIAGLMTKTNKIGFIGGISSPLIRKFMYGYKAGILSVNPKAEITEVWAESFGDAAIGKSLANQLYGAGCDIIYHAAGNVGKGLFESAIENKKWAIGVDSDQSVLAPDNILTSMMKRVDNAIFDVAMRLQAGELEGGEIVEYGIVEGGIDIAPTSSKNVPAEILAKTDEWKTKIINGEFVVPFDEATFESFKGNL